jgi:hypothetical protein
MRFRLLGLFAALTMSGVLPRSLAQEAPSEILNEQLPKWVRFGFDHRFRMQGYTALRYRDDNSDRWLLNRLRANLKLSPTAWWTFNFQGQDARIFFKSNTTGHAGQSEHRFVPWSIGRSGPDGRRVSSSCKPK